ncbi:7457_t:CDS:1 [Funneliformis geosporum]|uniref:17527_t:CDS:1 n=1 Tax=Funneliformis geosporum TaxID=1117311 RepID=A0A9W4WLY2_9GLOM|nr:7457_t:CDS:1 [Funneliformis geosporum]CAI2163743.1 17527_t:CDS:1 [Funneliformis geosporum]
MQNQKRASYCPAVRSELNFRNSYPGTFNANRLSLNIFSNKKPQVDEKIKVNYRRLSNTSNTSNTSDTSNTSLSSLDSGVGFSKADYEIQRALRAQRVQRPHIIVLHKGKPISNSKKNFNNYDEFEANLVVAAATASKRNRREISVMQKRQTIDFSADITSAGKLDHLQGFKSCSAPNLTIMESPQKICQDEELVKVVKQDKKPKRHSIMPKHKLSFKALSLTIKKFMGIKTETKKRSQLIQQIRENQFF